MSLNSGEREKRGEPGMGRAPHQGRCHLSRTDIPHVNPGKLPSLSLTPAPTKATLPRPVKKRAAPLLGAPPSLLSIILAAERNLEGIIRSLQKDAQRGFAGRLVGSYLGAQRRQGLQRTRTTPTSPSGVGYL